MLYENYDKELLKFVDSPIENARYLDGIQPPLSLWVKLKYRIPPLRKYISANDAKNIFEHLYASHLSRSSNCADNLSPSSYNPYNIENINKICNELNKYFRIGLLIESNLTETDKAIASDYIKINVFTKLEYHCNRISESYNLSDDYLQSIVSEENLWISFFLSEIYLLLRCGLLSANFAGGSLAFHTSQAYEKKLSRYWLSEILEANSKLSDTKFYMDMSKYLLVNRAIPKELVNPVIDNILDKIFSIHVNYVTNDISNNKRYKFLREIIFFSLVLECNSLMGTNSVDRLYFRKGDYISDNTLSYIDNALGALSEAKINNIGGFIHQTTSRSYARGSLSFKYGLRKFAGALLETMQNDLKGSDFKGGLGDSFETDYVLNYLKKLDYFGFKPYRGFKAGNKSLIKGYDVDIVLHDSENDIYYFIQVKYRFSALPTYLSERIKFFNEKSFKKGYLDQLVTLKENFNNENIRKQIDNIGLKGANTRNSHFVLLHNIPFLNFYEYKGVLFYEWNLLRNILQEGKIYWKKDSNSGDISSNSKLQLHKPDDIIAAYFDNSANGKDLKKQFELFKKSRCLFNLEKTNVQCQMN